MKKSGFICMISGLLIWGITFGVIPRFAFARTQRLCLSPRIEIQAPVFKSGFEEAAPIAGREISAETILRAGEVFNGYRDNIARVLSRIVVPFSTELRSEEPNLDTVAAANVWLEDDSLSAGRRRQQILIYTVYELLGNGYSRDFQAMLNGRFSSDRETSRHIGSLLCGCGTRSFLIYNLLCRQGSAEDIRVIDADRATHIFAARLKKQGGKRYYETIDSAEGRELLSADMHAGPEELRLVPEKLLREHGYRIHQGEEAQRFLLGYIFNNLGAVYLSAYEAGRDRRDIGRAKIFFLQALLIAPGYDVPRRNMLRLLESERDAAVKTERSLPLRSRRTNLKNSVKLKFETVFLNHLRGYDVNLPASAI